MNSNRMNRRQLITTTAGAGLGALLSPGASAQEKGGFPNLSAQDAGQLHRDKLKEIASVLGGTRLLTEEGLVKIIKHLLELRMISPEEAKVLEVIVSAIYQSKTVDEMIEKIASIYGKLEKKADDVFGTIVSIAHDSVTYAKEALTTLGMPRIIGVVSRDVSGALTGAGAGAKFDRRVAILFAIAGGVASSALAVYEDKPKPAVPAPKPN